MEISDILWATMNNHFRRIIDDKCKEYETSDNYKILRIIEEGKLVGFCVYHDEGEIRHLDEAHYLGDNKFVSVRMYKFLTKNAKVMRLVVQKFNTKMFELYQRMGFTIIGEDLSNYFMEKERV